MSKTESILISRPNDDTMKILIRRRKVNDGSHAESSDSSMSSMSSMSSASSASSKTTKSLKEVNEKLKKLAEQREQQEKSAKQEKKTKKKEKKIEKFPEEECDHLGVPLSHPLAVTPFPGKTSAAQREKARKMLYELAAKMHREEEEKKKGIPQASEKSQNTRSTDSSDQSSDKTVTSNLSQSKLSCVSDKTMGCDKCGSCQKCIQRCSKKHVAEQTVTREEREKFLRDMFLLRKLMQKPEKSRQKSMECAYKSPYDVTQSESEMDVTKSTSEKSSEKKKKRK